jgi:hypothetical protein
VFVFWFFGFAGHRATAAWHESALEPVGRDSA